MLQISWHSLAAYLNCFCFHKFSCFAWGMKVNVNCKNDCIRFSSFTCYYAKHYITVYSINLIFLGMSLTLSRTGVVFIFRAVIILGSYWFLLSGSFLRSSRFIRLSAFLGSFLFLMLSLKIVNFCHTEGCLTKRMG